MKKYAATQNSAITQKQIISPYFTSNSSDKNETDTTKFDNQLVVEANAFPTPQTWRGYISEFTVQGVDPIPIAYANMYPISDIRETTVPVFLSCVLDSGDSLYIPSPIPKNIIKKTTKGSVNFMI